MIEPSMWVSKKEASEILRVEEKYLEKLRERGVLKPGLHWRSSDETNQLPWNPKVVYFISGCKEIIEYCLHTDFLFDRLAA